MSDTETASPTLTPEQQAILDWLAGHSPAPLSAIQAATGQDAAQTAANLGALQTAGAIRAVLIQGQVHYRAMTGERNASSQGLPAALQARMAQDRLAFLRQVPLFRGLADEPLAVLAGRMQARHYARNDVILWQGQMGTEILFIQTGLVGITRVAPHREEAQLLAYLQPGDMIGEIALLAGQNRMTSATAVALSEVDGLVLSYAACADLLATHGRGALELARLLAQRLLATNERLTSNGIDVRLCLIYDLTGGTAGVLAGTALALALAAATHQPTAYTAYPDAGWLVEAFGATPGTMQWRHPGGFDVVAPRDVPGFPDSVRATALLDGLSDDYPNILIALPPQADETLGYILQRADQIVLVTTANQSVQEQAAALQTRLLPAIRPDRTSIYTVIVRKEANSGAAPGQADFDLILDSPPSAPGDLRADTLPPRLAALAGTLADRLGRTESISVYIPTTVSVDQAVDTGAYVQRTLNFLGDLFGGATANTADAQGVWKSDTEGLVDETIHIVRTYVTQADLARNLSRVIAYMVQLKEELQQEAMALEVNEKLMLI